MLRQTLFFLAVSLFVLMPTALAKPGLSAPALEIDAAANIDRLLDRLDSDMGLSSEQIEQGDYRAALRNKENSLKTLSLLLDLFLPLPERIKQLLEQEKEIIKQTETLSTAGNIKADELRSGIEPLRLLQRSNLERTKAAAEMSQFQIDEMKKKAAGSSLDANRSAANGQQQQMFETLSGVKTLLGQASDLQGSVIRHLENLNINQALTSEARAAEKLKEALELLQQDQQKNNQQDQQNNNQQQQKQSQQKQKSQPQQNREQQTGENRSEATQSAEQKSPQQFESKPENKLSAKEALRELSRLQKKAKDEKQRRERALGKQSVPGRAPIEKDW